jgi:hypothetical protein
MDLLFMTTIAGYTSKIKIKLPVWSVKTRTNAYEFDCVAFWVSHSIRVILTVLQ